MPGIDTTIRSVATASFLDSRSSLPYPNFSKAHSKEDVRHTIPTPDPTDLTEVTETPKTSGKTNGVSQNRENHHAPPPSPPLTGLSDQPSRKGTPVEEREEKTKTKKTNIKIRTTEVNRSSSSLRSKKDDGVKSSKSQTDSPKTKSSRTEKEKAEKEKSSPRASHKPSKSKLSDEKKLPKRSSRSTISPVSPSASNVTAREIIVESINGSDATSIAPNQQYNLPRKPPTPPIKPPSRNQTRSAASHRHALSEESIEYGRQTTSGPSYGAPPPPPPPPEVPISIPRVDYLLQYGGLEQRVPRTLLIPPSTFDPFSQQGTQPQQSAAKVFDPFNRLLDDYTKVMGKSGSLAVATGYRSVARRLLDRLEAVFARDISSEPCNCQMCDHDESEERPSGVSWGEVLELVSGRRELPMWPPFKMAASTVDADMSGEEHIPMQKLDVDVPEEYRDHFIRQSRKTKVAVDKWLSEQTTEQSTSAPHEVDDETLTFSMLTYLESYQRSLFCALLGINSATPVPRSDDKAPRTKPSAIVSSSLAIQRLYRLQSLPRDPETAMFMLNNHHLHHVLSTLAAITDDEWDILISGRFDGFLRSGAEDSLPPSNPRWTGSRSTTPGNGAIPRGTTPNYMDSSFRPTSQPNGGPPSPSSYGGPIALDEETEIAALAEIERDIFLGMEALEDAFEALHLKAEVVRRALRERGAGLSVANQSRRGSYVEARLGTPFSGAGPWESGDDDFLEDDRGSLAPDDSASNISSNRRRRPKRRSERRTPAPVEEEDEEDSQSGRRERNSRRR
ncbi:hypothetical protein N7495_002761 [Penicillium taxi]|uniref:uncharacterized protein n=1 Tax=Penicillium taxi TaxID=168475 RepID=UPI0025455A60|nr:uncharacterized protein N7495_002761 [Penicillium taxi]KAJ5902233.1 hypothetical protein N7495_002761 [Penicillium taxi]